MIISLKSCLKKNISDISVTDDILILGIGGKPKFGSYKNPSYFVRPTMWGEIFDARRLIARKKKFLF